MPAFHVLQGPDKGRTYTTTDDTVVIGRSAGQIPLTDHAASRRHAEIHREGDHWILKDLNSSNGTYLNGQRLVTPTQLKHGDQIKLGSSLLVFEGQAEPETPFGGPAIQDLVDLDPEGAMGGSSILAAIDSSAESVILQPPESADAVVAWNVVYKIAELIGTAGSSSDLLTRVADVIFDHLIGDHLVVLTTNPESGAMEPGIVRYRRKERGPRPKIVTSQKIIDHVVVTQSGVLCANAMNDERFAGDMQDSIHRFGLRSVVCVPIIVRDKVYGVLHLDCSTSQHTYTQEQLRLAVSIGKLTGLAIEHSELLESRVRNERLAAAGETVAFLSHHIRNILQGMQGGAEIIEMGLKKKAIDVTESGWSLVSKNLERILHLTVNMITFSKKRQPKIEMLHLNHIAKDVIELAWVRAKERGVELQADLDEVPAAALDGEGMHQVIHNIVLNAIDVAPAEGGRVVVETSYARDTGHVTVSITDNGPGIPPDKLDVIFDAFHSSKGHGGTGLGLAAAKKIIEELNGEILIESEVGHGATFHVVIPTERVHLADSDDTLGY